MLVPSTRRTAGSVGLATILLALTFAGGTLAQDVFIAGATLIDPVADAPVHANLLILDGVVAGRPATPPSGFTGTTIDGTGKFVIPGLHDLHVHSFGHMGADRSMHMLGTPGTAAHMLYCGVTGFLDLFSAEAAILPLRDRQRADPAAVRGADIFAAGPCLTATSGHCSEYGIPTRLIDTPDDARRQIAELATKKPDVVKIVFQRESRMPTIDVPTLEAAIAAAKDHGLKTVIHTQRWGDAREAVRAGATAITHTPEDGVVPDDIVALMVANGTYWIPTLAVHGDVEYWVADPARLDDPLLVAVTTPELRATFARELSPPIAAWVTRAKTQRDTRHASARKLWAAGVPIVTGTDAGNPGTFLGYSVHRELALLVEAGVTPRDALAAATVTAGKLLDRGWGLADGDEGSVVVLDASPLDAIANTEKIHAVIHHGVVIDRAALLR